MRERVNGVAAFNFRKLLREWMVGAVSDGVARKASVVSGCPFSE
tara:strand:- start:728 stop:859 length:132 start_codon:yes stop_codon:yes gene_type:complete